MPWETALGALISQVFWGFGVCGRSDRSCLGTLARDQEGGVGRKRRTVKKSGGGERRGREGGERMGERERGGGQ